MKPQRITMADFGEAVSKAFNASAKKKKEEQKKP
jgi:hypothetical protein